MDHAVAVGHELSLKRDVYLIAISKESPTRLLYWIQSKANELKVDVNWRSQRRPTASYTCACGVGSRFRHRRTARCGCSRHRMSRLSFQREHVSAIQGTSWI